MATETTINANSVKWELIEVLDVLKPHQWVEALVRFEKDGYTFTGSLQLDPNNPHGMHDSIITDVQPDENFEPPTVGNEVV